MTVPHNGVVDVAEESMVKFVLFDLAVNKSAPSAWH